MKIKNVVLVVIAITLVSVLVVWAGSPDSPGAPTDAGAQMYTLEQIYDRLDTGAAATKMTEFTEPSTAPGIGTMHTLNEIMDVAPEADDTNGATAADVASGKTFWGLTSGEWGLQTGTATGGGGAGVPQTGQTTSYATGDDGDLEKGVAWPNPRFTDNDDGTVTDNLTGLIWLKDANCAGTTANWATALGYANALYDGCTSCFGTSGDCGLSDGSIAGAWRLPNVRELHSLIDFSQFSSPVLPSGHPFTGVYSSYYWSSTTDAYDIGNAWQVRLNDGRLVFNDKDTGFYVWPVRGGQ